MLLPVHLKMEKGTQLKRFASAFSQGHANPLCPFCTHPPHMSLEAFLHVTAIDRIAEMYPTPWGWLNWFEAKSG